MERSGRIGGGSGKPTIVLVGRFRKRPCLLTALCMSKAVDKWANGIFNDTSYGGHKTNVCHV